ASGVEPEGEEEVLADVAHYGPAEMACANDTAQVALDQRDGRALHRDIGASAHGNADISCSEGRRIVNAIARHSNPTALFAQVLDDGLFLLGQHIGHDLIDAADISRHRFCGTTVVASQHD